MCALKIVADENMPLINEFFADFGDITFVAGRSITPTIVKEADLLLVRSITPVNESLLKESKVRFVGTATIGFDHVDINYLNQRKIGFACAPGCNANSVVEYIISCLSVLTEQNQFNLLDKTVGIVGVGNVGGLLRKRLAQLGVNCIANDPPKAEQGEKGLVELDELIEQADIISLHTPLTLVGQHYTQHLFNEARLQKLKPNSILINTGRGAVIDNQALLTLLNNRHDVSAVLDVWENEPDINVDLLYKTTIATPHIAGYSLDGKMRGTEMIYQAACRYFGLPIRKKLGQYLPENTLSTITFTPNATWQAASDIAVRACYDVRRDDGVLRNAACQHGYVIGKMFDELRKNYPTRREFNNVKIKLKNGKTDLIELFKALGFLVKLD